MICPHCGRCYDSTWKVCLQCGAGLDESPVVDPRIRMVRSPQSYLTQLDERKKFSVNIYGLKRRKDDANVVRLFEEKTDWPREKVCGFLEASEHAEFQDLTRSEAVSLVLDFERQEIIAALGPGEISEYHLNQFARFRAKGRFVPSWNWAAAFLTWMWQWSKGLWAKWAIYAIVLTGLSMAGRLLTIGGLFFYSIFIVAAAFIFYGVTANYDYYLLKTRDESLWPKWTYARLKKPFWIVVILAFAAIAADLFLTARQTASLARAWMDGGDPVTGSVSIRGVIAQPEADWRMVRGLPAFFGGGRNEETVLFTIPSRRMAQLYLTVRSGKFNPDNAYQTIGPLADTWSVPFFRMRPGNVDAGQNEFVQAGDRRWIRRVRLMRFENGPEDFAHIVYASATSNCLVTLVYQGPEHLKGKSANDLLGEWVGKIRISEEQKPS